MVEFMIECGKVPPVIGASDLVTDELKITILEYANNSTEVQLWYDQYLPTAVATSHLDTCQSVFGLSMTPEEAMAEWQASMDEELGN